MNSINLEMPVRFVKGVGPEKSKVLARLGLETLEDLFYCFPRRYEARTPVKKIGELTLTGKECVTGTVISRGFVRRRGGQSIFKAVVSDEKNVLFGMWFNQPYLSKIFLPKTRVIFYGSAEPAGKHLQMVHPEYEILKDGGPVDSPHVGRIAPIYPLTEDLTQKSLRQLLFGAIGQFAWTIRDGLPYSFRKKLSLPDRVFAFRQIHFPSSEADRLKAYRRLVFDEFFAMQLMVQLRKNRLQNGGALPHRDGIQAVERFKETLGFALTPGQESAIADMLDDMKKPNPMNRLVQGDVGSGKTAVAAAGLLFTVCNGFQGALMAPTEVLAQQHAFTLSQLLEPFNVRVAYFAQDTPGVSRAEILLAIASGDAQVIVGTHALIQPDVRFKKLGLVIIDEQHKFGVVQRSTLKAKGGQAAHLLLMTATPIPRTLALTLYGDLDISTIREKPQTRKPVRTFWVEESRRQEIYRLVDAEIEKGRQAYVVCPRINEDEKTKGVLWAEKELRDAFGRRSVAVLHGRLKPEEKRKIMAQFKAGSIQILIATVVIEVGVDVPNATVLLIENADKFGLAQLHQLRGRVGRGSEESLCLIFSGTTNPESVDRLRAFEESASGFDIAQKDLDLRGAGELIGKKQHGIPELRIGDWARDWELLELARREAKAWIEKDPRLEKKENQLLRRDVERRFPLLRGKWTDA